MKLNFGCGSVQPECWVNVDRVDYGQEHVADVLDGLPFADETFACVVANHSLSDLDHHQLPKALVELRRVLQPGGVLRILVPDLLGAVDAYQDNDVAWFPLGDDLPSIDERLCTFVGWFGTAKSQWTYGYATVLCLAAGFEQTAEAEPHETVLGDNAITELDDREVQALIVEARK